MRFSVASKVDRDEDCGGSQELYEQEEAGARDGLIENVFKNPCTTTVPTTSVPTTTSSTGSSSTVSSSSSPTGTGTAVDNPYTGYTVSCRQVSCLAMLIF